MTTASALHYLTPAFVAITYRDGTSCEMAFSTRIKAEAFIYSIPIMAYYEPESEFADIARVKLRPAQFSIN